MSSHPSTIAGQAYAEVIGDPIAQSKSPLIHGFWLEKLAIEAGFRACHVKPEELNDYFAERRADPNWRGCNITMPHKQSAMAYVDQVESSTETIGAINTVYRDGEKLVGANTDGAGFLEPLRDELAQEHYFRMARILGTGGAARAIIAALAGEGFTLVVAGRDPDKARGLLDELAPDGEHHAVHLDHFAEPTDFAFDDREGCLDVIINATALGMKGQPPLVFDLSHAPPRSIFYDIVYSPLETALLADAAMAGFRTLDGLNMLIGQAAIAFRHFFGETAPRDHDGELRELLLR
ncbi:shikimate dehydrogenase [Altererythrobacter lutimaris]|uniref:Shikimate dehydrogenase (NADP(+)) n=1 Tax=Altererythrobacter lutimaris TaxID=2743979 RepID=A0A850HCB2_9SPHN|nr:shikimate dehydrogenase [Altererythrobacter lutimaris]NVE95399.1 shikimate dehydrogenase [Altererythrobacter lutimaris]